MKNIFALCFTLLLCHAVSISAQIMFPGDANNDGRCNHVDILPIGILHGQEVFPRNFPSLNWQPQPFPLFPGQLPVSGVNFAFSDSDGNGFIDSLDLDALALNYDLLQNQSQPPPQPYILDDTLHTTNTPCLRLRFLQDTVLVGDTAIIVIEFVAPIILPPKEAALGFAVSLKYETDNVQDSLTRVYVDSMPGDLMFVASAVNFRDIWRTASGTIEISVAGKGKNTLDRTRDLAFIIIEIDVILRSGEARPFTMAFGDVLMINKDEQVLRVKLQTDTVILFQPTDGVTQPEPTSLHLSPNPVQDLLHIESPDAPIERMEVFSTLGKRVMSVDGHSENRFDLRVEGLPPGIFLLAVRARGGVVLRKFVRL
ncbi:MAG: T9SS type A sorting domain-containing protein [Saprospiraceae bacterium]